MAFANLFSSLATVNENETRPDRSDLIFRSKTEDGVGERKRKAQSQQRGSHKRRCYQTSTSFDTFRPNVQTKGCQRRRADSEDRGDCRKNNHSSKPGYNSTQNCKNHNYKTKQNRNVKQQQWKQANQQQHRNRMRNNNKDGRNFPKKDGRDDKDIRQEKPRFMTPEFMEQNALLVDGRLLCRHFLWGRCIKAEECQLEHVQGHNDLIKESCKFYIQGFCWKGESCPYMHNILLLVLSSTVLMSFRCFLIVFLYQESQSFPCKFFHRKRTCLHEENCKFSHDPLNEVTEKLLDEVLKQEKEYFELSKEAKQDPSEQPTSETDVVDANLDVLPQPLSFYNSTEAQTETNIHQADEGGSVAAEPHCSPSNSPNPHEPVSYSVEAVLGSQHSRTLSCFSKIAGSEESSSVSVHPVSSDTALGLVNQSEVPYSVDAVLRSCKSLNTFSFGSAPPPLTARTASYTPGHVNPLRQPENKKKTIQNTRDVTNAFEENTSRSFSSHREDTVLISDSTSDSSLTSEDPKKKDETLLRFQKSSEISSNEVKLELSSPVTEAETSGSSRTKGEASHPEVCTRNTKPPKQPAHLKPDVSAPMSNSQSYSKAFSPSLNVCELKGGRLVPPATPVETRAPAKVAVHQFATRRLTEILQKKPSALKRATLEDSSKIASKSEIRLSVGLNKTPNRLLSSLFANSLTDGVTPTSAAAPVCSQSLTKPQRAAGVEEKKTSASFISLFAAPLSGTLPFPRSSSQAAECTQQSHEQTSEQSTNLKNKSDAVNQLVAPVSSQPESPGRSGQLQTDASSPRGSFLKTLFLHLKPYQDDKEQDSSQSIVRSDRFKQERSSTECVDLKQQQKSLSTEKTASLSADVRFPSWTSQSSSEPAGGSMVNCPGVTEPQVRKTGTHTLPFKPVTQRDSSLRGKRAHGNSTATPLKDLFKTLETPVFHK
ncbi:streptococcal hemagglutinin isoform X1 [Nothobranchius furzeri]|uniref:C3H1-type domain-containing protein n=1 Tax=Nothobranchius furzeri TaxID=105023 RepID=A0A8C6M9U9_NOTFU